MLLSFIARIQRALRLFIQIQHPDGNVDNVLILRSRRRLTTDDASRATDSKSHACVRFFFFVRFFPQKNETSFWKVNEETDTEYDVKTRRCTRDDDADRRRGRRRRRMVVGTTVEPVMRVR